METLFRIALIMTGIIHIYPMIAAVAPRTLRNLYGVAIEDADLLVLLRHRAVLFGLLGGFLIVAAFDRALYAYALIPGLVSMLSYVAIAFPTRNPKLRRVMLIDIILSHPSHS